MHQSLHQAIVDADIFIGLSVGNVLDKEMVKKMAKDPIIFAMANPTPEIDPRLAREVGAAIIATGRSDYPNQVNNVLAFPGIFHGALDAKATRITAEMKLAAALALAGAVKNPTREKILPSPLEKHVAKVIGMAVRDKAIEQKVIRPKCC